MELLRLALAFALALLALYPSQAWAHAPRRLRGASPNPLELPHRVRLAKRATCGDGIGSCSDGECCSEAGFCGTTEDYCKGPGCRIKYSGTTCDASRPPPGGTTSGVPRPRFGAVPYGTLITACTVPGLVALTYDDGPGPYTAELLDVLDRNDARATFFVAGNSGGRGMISDPSTPWPGLLRRMHAAGHHLASHTWTHEDFGTASDDVRRDQIVFNEMAFRDVLGVLPTYFRPPYARCYADDGCLDLMGSFGYHVVNFDVDTKDYAHDNPSLIQTSKDIFAAALAAGRPDADSFVVLVHDTHRQTATNLTQFMLDTLSGRGYRAVTLGECLGDPPENWYRDAGSGAPTTPTVGATVTVTGIMTGTMTGTGTGTATGTGTETETGTGTGTETGTGAETGTGTLTETETATATGTGILTETETATATSQTESTATLEPRIDVSPDGTCGSHGGNTYTCLGSAKGDCCSPYGFCGRTSGYCDGGCQPTFGRCNPIGDSDPLVVSANGLCGAGVMQTCAGSSYGDCCSSGGFCGSAAGYCGDGCQGGFGTCG